MTGYLPHYLQTVTNHCAGKRKGCHSPPPPKSAARNAVIRFMGVWLKNRISEGYSVALFPPIDLKFGMYTRLGVLDSRLKFQVSISSRTGVTGGSHLLKIQCNGSVHAYRRDAFYRPDFSQTKRDRDFIFSQLVDLLDVCALVVVGSIFIARNVLQNVLRSSFFRL